jgi:hypothetical protein
VLIAVKQHTRPENDRAAPSPESLEGVTVLDIRPVKSRSQSFTLSTTVRPVWETAPGEEVKLSEYGSVVGAVDLTEE